MEGIEGICHTALVDESISLLFEVAPKATRFDGFACSLQRERERLLRDAGHKRSDHPAKPRGNVSRQRSHFTLDVNAADALFHAPPRFHPPHDSVVVARCFFAFIALPAFSTSAMYTAVLKVWAFT